MEKACLRARVCRPALNHVDPRQPCTCRARDRCFPVQQDSPDSAISVNHGGMVSSRFLLSTQFLPHWYCYVGNRRLAWTNVISDLVIGFSYVLISATLAWLVRRAGKHLPYTHFFWAFGVFIVSCGGTHFMEVVTVWWPVYWLAGAVKRSRRWLQRGPRWCCCSSR